MIQGNHTTIIPIDKDLEKIYHRKNLCLKVFAPQDKPIDQVRWSLEDNGFRENLLECTKIQNLLALQGFAPRVYDLIFIDYKGNKCPAQVTDYIAGKDGDINTDRIKRYCEEVGIKYHDIENDGANMRGGLFTDTQEFEFGNYESGLKERMAKGLAYAGSINISYQSIDELAIGGERDNLEREKLLEIDATELPKNFSVLDFGCNGAYFTRRAFDKGAKYGVGVDIPRVITASAELNNYLGYFNIDFVTQVPDQQFDLVLLLAAFTYAKPEEIFPKAKVAYIEGHCFNNQHTEEYYKKILEPYYTKIVTLGWVRDDPQHPPRVVMKGLR